MNRPLTERDIDLLRELTATSGTSFSEMCAANLYLFRRAHAYRVNLDDIPHVRGVSYDGVAHALPLSFCDDDALEELVRVTGLVLYPQAPRNGWASIYNADDSDYIFLSADLATYAGGVRKAKRNLPPALSA